MLLCHGCHASPRLKRWQSGSPVLRYLRVRPIVPCVFGGSRRRPGFERHRGFHQRKALREELQQRDGFVSDGWWALCNRRDENVLQRILPPFGKKRRGFDTLVRSV